MSTEQLEIMENKIPLPDMEWSIKNTEVHANIKNGGITWL